ncbi:MAG: ASCH domain-containing protein [Bacteroidota bacterium]
MLLGFNKQFENPILRGTKIHTLRKHKRKPKDGERLHMYRGLKTPDCKLITNKKKLDGTQKVWIKICVFHDTGNAIKICVDGKKLTPEKITEFCINDGFVSLSAFIYYWIKEHRKKQGNLKVPFKIIKSLNCHHWTPFRY